MFHKTNELWLLYINKTACILTPFCGDFVQAIRQVINPFGLSVIVPGQFLYPSPATRKLAALRIGRNQPHGARVLPTIGAPARGANLNSGFYTPRIVVSDVANDLKLKHNKEYNFLLTMKHWQVGA